MSFSAVSLIIKTVKNMAEEYIIAKHKDGSVLTVRDVQAVLLDMIKDIDEIMRRHHIPYWLSGGSALGAVRHQGFIPWDDDMDIAMMRSDYERFLTEALPELPDRYVFQCYEKDAKFNVCVPAKLVLKHTHIQEYNTLLKSKCEYGDGLFIDFFVCDEVSMKRSRDLPRRLLNVSLMGLITVLENIGLNPKPLKNWFVHNARRYGEINRGSDSIGYALTWCFNSLLHPVRYPKDSVFPIQYVKFADTTLPIPHNPHVMLDIEVSPNHMSYPPLKDQRPKHIRDAQL